MALALVVLGPPAQPLRPAPDPPAGRRGPADPADPVDPAAPAAAAAISPDRPATGSVSAAPSFSASPVPGTPVAEPPATGPLTPIFAEPVLPGATVPAAARPAPARRPPPSLVYCANCGLAATPGTATCATCGQRFALTPPTVDRAIAAAATAAADPGEALRPAANRDRDSSTLAPTPRS